MCEFFGGSMLEQWRPPEVHRQKAEVHHGNGTTFFLSSCLFVISPYTYYQPSPNNHSTITNECKFCTKSSGFGNDDGAMLAPATRFGLRIRFFDPLKFYPSKVVKADYFQVVLVHVYIYIYIYSWIFQVCNICAFSPKKHTKRQKIYIFGRSRYIHAYPWASTLRGGVTGPQKDTDRTQNLRRYDWKTSVYLSF